MTWINHVNSHFVDADGNAASETARITTLMPLLSYQYESSAIGSSPADSAIATKAAYQAIERRIRNGANIRFEIKQRIHLSDRAIISIAKPLFEETSVGAIIIDSDAAMERVFVSVEFAQLPPNSEFSVRVFLNLPMTNTGTPIEDPHYAGSFTFFGTDLQMRTGASTNTNPSS